MALIPVGEWLPDLPAFQNPGAITATNVIPLTSQSYGPAPASVVPYPSASLASRCLGYYVFHDPTLNVYNFAGDANHIFLLETGSTSFVDVSKSAGGPYTVDPSYFWDTCSFGNNIIFTNLSDPIQSFLAGSSAQFSDLSATAPRARWCTTIRDFLMIGYTSDGSTNFPYRLQWSAVGNPSNWPTPGTNAAIEVQSDEQDLQQTDLGAVTSLVGNGLIGADGAAFCEHGIYRILYVGSPAIFDFQVAQGGVGTTFSRSIVAVRGIVYYIGPDQRFYAFDGANPSMPIGGLKVDNFFQKDVDPSAVKTTIATADPVRPLIYWAYSSPGASMSGLFNKLLVYNWLLGRWSLIDITGQEIEWLSNTLTLGYSLDQLDAFGPLDTLPYPLDSAFWTGGAYVLSGINAAHKLVTFGGSNLAATIDTGEAQVTQDRSTRITMTRPILDAVGASVAIASRNNPFDPVTFGPAVTANAVGWHPQLSEGRYQRGRITIPAGTAFTQLQGIEVIGKPRGRLR